MRGAFNRSWGLSYTNTLRAARAEQFLLLFRNWLIKKLPNTRECLHPRDLCEVLSGSIQKESSLLSLNTVGFTHCHHLSCWPGVEALQITASINYNEKQTERRGGQKKHIRSCKKENLDFLSFSFFSRSHYLLCSSPCLPLFLDSPCL